MKVSHLTVSREAENLAQRHTASQQQLQASSCLKPRPPALLLETDSQLQTTVSEIPEARGPVLDVEGAVPGSKGSWSKISSPHGGVEGQDDIKQLFSSNLSSAQPSSGGWVTQGTV